MSAECEWKASGDHDWIKVRVLAYHEDEVWLKSLLGGTSFAVGNPAGFRPIRTESERKRSDICDKIYGAITNAERKDNRSDMAEAVYDAIAAGKIPGVKLEAPDED